MEQQASWIDKIIRFSLENKLIVALVVLFAIGWGAMVAPFDWKLGGLPRDPVPVDAIPDIGENQQIVFTQWMGRSPQDVEDQITYPLTSSLLGIPGVKTVRSYSYFGFSTIYVIFKDDVDFYWSRSRLLEKLNSLPPETLPPNVQPTLGPDATALGQIFWYTLEGRDKHGKPVGGWNLEELRSIQDWTVRYALLAAEGISEVASVGGYVREYQIDVDPDAMRAHHITLDQVYNAVRNSNIDVGARSIEVNNVEYFIRGLGFIKQPSDIEDSVVKVENNVPLYVKNVAHVTLGPASRRGALDKEGAEAVGGVAVVRYGENPLAAIKSVKAKIKEITPGLPSKPVIDYRKVTPQQVRDFAQANGFQAYTGSELNRKAWVAWLQKASDDQQPDWVKLSKVTVVPFYDRSGLIYETLGTLNSALTEEILVTIIVVLVMVMHLRSSALISLLLPLAVLMCFIAMKLFHIDANIVALSGIAIAIGTMVDMGIVICENILKHLDEASPDANRLEVVYQASKEVGSAVITAVATTVISFLPVFAMQAAEGKLFKPLAFTKTFALIASLVVALTIIPPAAHILFTWKPKKGKLAKIGQGLLFAAGIYLGFAVDWRLGAIVAALAAYRLLQRLIPQKVTNVIQKSATWLVVVLVAYLLAHHWLPLGPEKGIIRNFIFVASVIGGLLLVLQLFIRVYEHVLRWCLNHKLAFMAIPTVMVILGVMAWQGFDRFFGWLPEPIRKAAPVEYIAETFPGVGKEFMPPLDEGSYLFMPTTMPHASIGEALDVLQKQDIAMKQVPEVETSAGKLGRADTSLDPAPISMFETVINYKPEYLVDRSGNRLRYKFDPNTNDFFRDKNGQPLLAPDGQPYRVRGKFIRDESGNLIPDDNGKPFRQWRPAMDPALNPDRLAWGGINEPDDIWNQIVAMTKIPGTTSAPRLQPIAARIVMLQSGMRAPMGVKIKGPDLRTIEKVGLQIEQYLKEVPSVQANTVIADRIVGKPYLEININREKIARYGIPIAKVQQVIEVAIGGKKITTTVEGRERYPVRVRYMRELRDNIESLEKILVAAPNGAQIPLGELAKIDYVRGPQVVKSEDTFLVGYVIFDMRPGEAEVDVVEQCQNYLHKKLDSGEWVLPAGVSYKFAGSYENQVRSEKRLMIVLPIALGLIFLILYLQFSRVPTTLLVFSGIIVAWAGGFIMIWLYDQSWFLNFSVFGTNMRDLFQAHTINLSVAIWVGFLALFGIASDNGVIIATYLDESFRKRKTTTVDEIREATVIAGKRRVRPCLMTTATTILALIPVLTSTGRGSDVMVPMAIPSFGGMVAVILTLLMVPVLYSLLEELKLKFNKE